MHRCSSLEMNESCPLKQSNNIDSDACSKKLNAVDESFTVLRYSI